MILNQDIHSWLSKVPLFDKLDNEALQRLARIARIHKHEKGKFLFLSGDEAQNYYLITKGWVKLFRETRDGDQAVIDILPAGHLFGETSIFENNKSPYSAEVVEDAEIITLSIKEFSAEIESNSELALKMLKSMARYSRRQDTEIEHKSIQNAAQRIGCFLLHLAPQQNSSNSVTIQLPYDKTLVASRLGMQPETFSRALSKLRDQTGIIVKGATIELENLDQLVNYSCSACSSEFPCKDSA